MLTTVWVYEVLECIDLIKYLVDMPKRENAFIRDLTGPHHLKM